MANLAEAQSSHAAPALAHALPSINRSISDCSSGAQRLAARILAVRHELELAQAETSERTSSSAGAEQALLEVADGCALERASVTLRQLCHPGSAGLRSLS